MDEDILIVGAGPVGLFTAIELKSRNPSLNIKIIDKYNEYSRDHILRIEKESLVNSITYQLYPEVQKLHGFVRTLDIENTFLTIAKKLNITVETGTTITDPQAFLAQHPKAHTLIGADGARSIVRTRLFDDKKIVDRNLQYIVEIKYKTNGPTSRLPNNIYGPALGQVHHLVSENVGKEKNGMTPVSLFTFVDEETFNEIRKTPNAKLSDLQPKSKQMMNLLNTIRPWLSLRRSALNEELITDSEKINGVALSVYQSACFAKKINEKRVYLVGDAAAGVPYFRALNAGLISATLTAEKIATADKNGPDLESLNAQLATLAQQEIQRAYRQNKKVDIGQGLNVVLSHGFKLTTGALLDERDQSAMLNARVTRTNIFRRNPRVLMTLSLFATTTIAAYIIGLMIPALAIYPIALFAISVAGAITLTCIALFTLTKFIINLVRKKNNPVVPLPEFPWETEDKEQDSSLSLSKFSHKRVKGQAYTARQEQQVEQYSSPLAQTSAPSSSSNEVTPDKKDGGSELKL
jgi:2-polyprenyl-6-methoxyphenol hydroxylase-like FAD-dependent oxidoreductase